MSEILKKTSNIEYIVFNTLNDIISYKDKYMTITYAWSYSQIVEHILQKLDSTNYMFNIMKLTMQKNEKSIYIDSGEIFKVNKLWFDKKSIPYDTQAYDVNIKNMNLIYARAYAALLIIEDKVLPDWFDDTITAMSVLESILRSSWISRAWTLQEMLMSKKIILIDINCDMYDVTHVIQFLINQVLNDITYLRFMIRLAKTQPSSSIMVNLSDDTKSRLEEYLSRNESLYYHNSDEYVMERNNTFDLIDIINMCQMRYMSDKNQPWQPVKSILSGKIGKINKEYNISFILNYDSIRNGSGWIPYSLTTDNNQLKQHKEMIWTKHVAILQQDNSLHLTGKIYYHNNLCEKRCIEIKVYKGDYIKYRTGKYINNYIELIWKDTLQAYLILNVIDQLDKEYNIFKFESIKINAGHVND